MKRRLLIASLLAACAVGWFGGMLFEHYVGMRRWIDWVGVDHLLLQYRARATSDRVPVPWPSSAKGRVMVALVFGQSNAGNSGESPGAAHAGVYEFYRGRVFEARDPLLGAEGSGGSIWLRLGARLLTQDRYDTVVLVPIAIGSSEIRRWAPGGSLNGWLMSVIGDAHASGLKFTHLLWHQGEADAMTGTSPDEYRKQFGALLASIRAQGVEAPIFVAQTSRCARFLPSGAIRDAQHSLIDPALGIYSGPDTDTLGREARYDGCHFSTEGLDQAAELWLKSLLAATASEMKRSSIR